MIGYNISPVIHRVLRLAFNSYFLLRFLIIEEKWNFTEFKAENPEYVCKTNKL